MNPPRAGSAATSMESPMERREIDLDRRVCTVQPDRIDVRPARSAAVVPLLGLLLGVAAFVVVLRLLEQLPLVVALVLMGTAILLVPLSGMGFVYSIFGASVIIEKRKQSAVWQQGMLGLGVGTKEVVPFSKIVQIEVADANAEPQMGGPQDLAQYEIMLLKTSDRKLSLGQVTVPRDAASEGLARARDAAEAVAALVDKPLRVAPEAGGPGRRRRGRRRRQSEPSNM